MEVVQVGSVHHLKNRLDHQSLAVFGEKDVWVLGLRRTAGGNASLVPPFKYDANDSSEAHTLSAIPP